MTSLNLIKIRQIINSDWPSIIKIQHEAYTDILPESELILQSKSIQSPETCLVATKKNVDVIGYCLSHPWAPDSSPALYLDFKIQANLKNLYIHDLAISHKAIKQGIAGSLCNNIISIAKKKDFKSITLVSIQNSENFWSKFGFEINTQIIPSSTYGENAKFMQLKL